MSQETDKASATEVRSIGTCPACGEGEVLENSRAWGCSNWQGDDGCKYTIWKVVAGKELTRAQVEVLIQGETTQEIEGFTSKAGKSFSARLAVDDSDTGHVAFVFK